MAEQSRTPQTLGDFSRVVLRRKITFLAVALLVTAAGVGWSLTQPTVYRATTTVIIRTAQADALFPTAQGASDPKRRVLNEISVIRSAAVRDQVVADLQLGWVPPVPAGASTTTADVVNLSIDSGDAAMAAKLVNAYVVAYNEVKAAAFADRVTTSVGELQDTIDELQASIDEVEAAIAKSDTDDDSSRNAERTALLNQQADYRRTLQQQQMNAGTVGNAAEVVRPAPVPGSPDSPKPLRDGVMALLAGLLLGLGAAVAHDRLDRSINDRDDLDKIGTHLPLLAMVPHVAPSSGLPLAMQQPRHMAVESYRVLRTAVEFLAVDNDAKVIQVSSAIPAEGKTTTAVNLAVVLAAAGSSVVLVDADLRMPRVHEQFGLQAAPGLSDNLVGLGLSGSVRNIATNLDLLTSGRVPTHPSEMLGSKRMAALLDGLRQRYDFVIVDSAPIVPVSDARALARLVDAVVLVVKSGRSTVPRVRGAIDLLQQIEVPMLGVVLNDIDVSRRAARDQYGYGYGYGEGYGDDSPSAGVRL